MLRDQGCLPGVQHVGVITFSTLHRFPVRQTIIAGRAKQVVRASTAIESVVAIIPVEIVVTRSTEKLIVAHPATEIVKACSAIQRIRPPLPLETVISVEAEDEIVAFEATDEIGP
ncbi:hypothetical protein D3C71_1672090 [compost metagenome]